MELKITTTIYIEIDVIKEIMEDSGYDVTRAIQEYVDEMDDCEYYLIGDDEKEQIKNFIEKNTWQIKKNML